MKNNAIGIMLKQYRILNDLTVREVVVELENRYGLKVSEKSVYGWESSQANPRSEVFVALCDIYKINNVSETFYSKEAKGFSITLQERKLIENFRRCPEMHHAIRKLLDQEE